MALSMTTAASAAMGMGPMLGRSEAGRFARGRGAGRGRGVLRDVLRGSGCRSLTGVGPRDGSGRLSFADFAPWGGSLGVPQMGLRGISPPAPFFEPFLSFLIAIRVSPGVDAWRRPRVHC